VEPTVGSDGETIDLNLSPQVVEFDGFVNYGTPIYGAPTPIYSPLPPFAQIGFKPPAIITANTINQPVFDTRKVTTSVSVWDGQTVIIGGLVREDVQSVNDKVPGLGDLPLLGRFFRSNVDQHIKRNLVMFVTAHLVNPAGDLIHEDEEKEEDVQTLGAPELPVTPSLPDIPMGK
ncbi:MAG TPA: type II and III secretion system protein, partial [Chthoniobacteraceae bacterium]|nr:type II and III secretion system protein [Chthoniobacteraceae bacterium]